VVATGATVATVGLVIRIDASFVSAARVTAGLPVVVMTAGVVGDDEEDGAASSG